MGAQLGCFSGLLALFGFSMGYRLGWLSKIKAMELIQELVWNIEVSPREHHEEVGRKQSCLGADCFSGPVPFWLLIMAPNSIPSHLCESPVSSEACSPSIARRVMVLPFLPPGLPLQRGHILRRERLLPSRALGAKPGCLVVPIPSSAAPGLCVSPSPTFSDPGDIERDYCCCS